MYIHSYVRTYIPLYVHYVRTYIMYGHDMLNMYGMYDIVCTIECMHTCMHEQAQIRKTCCSVFTSVATLATLTPNRTGGHVKAPGWPGDSGVQQSGALPKDTRASGFRKVRAEAHVGLARGLVVVSPQSSELLLALAILEEHAPHSL